MFCAGGRTVLACHLTGRTVRVFVCVNGASICTHCANVGAESAKIAMMLGTSCQCIHCSSANVRAIEIDQRAICATTLPNIGSRANLGCVNCFFASFNAGLKIFVVRARSLHEVSHKVSVKPRYLATLIIPRVMQIARSIGCFLRPNLRVFDLRWRLFDVQLTPVMGVRHRAP